MTAEVRIEFPEGGLSDGLHVFDVESGQEIHGIESIIVQAKAGDVVSARIKIACASIPTPVTAQATFFASDPMSGDAKEIKSIEFADGTRWPR